MIIVAENTSVEISVKLDNHIYHNMTMMEEKKINMVEVLKDAKNSQAIS